MWQVSAGGEGRSSWVREGGGRGSGRDRGQQEGCPGSPSGAC